MIPVGGATDQHDPEFDVVQWFDAEKAVKVLAHSNEANVLQKALDIIAERNMAGPSERT
jgi:hypothetical protein